MIGRAVLWWTISSHFLPTVSQADSGERASLCQVFPMNYRSLRSIGLQMCAKTGTNVLPTVCGGGDCEAKYVAGGAVGAYLRCE